MSIPEFDKKLVRPLREAYAETQYEFAARMGVSQPAVARWEDQDDPLIPRGPAAILMTQMAKKKKILNPA